MTLDTRFSTELRTMEDAPELLQAAMRRVVPADSAPRLLIYGPSFVTMEERRPATLLAVTDTGWALASDDESEAAAVVACSFEDTLLLEVTRILLYGRFRIDFIVDREARAAMLGFNTVVSRLYLRAADMILKGIDPGSSDGQPGQAPAVSVEAWPAPFRNAVGECLMPDRHLLAAVQWPAIRGGLGRELAPAGALLATRRELVLISEERSDPLYEEREQSKWGSVATYFPAVRLARYHIEPHARFTLLGLETHASHGGERLDLLVPRELESEIEEIVSDDLRAKADA